MQATYNGSLVAGPHGQSPTISGILVQPALAAGDTIIVYENGFSESWSASGGTATPPDGSDPLLTIYNEDITFPSFDITIKAAPLWPGQGKVIEIRGTGADSVVSFDSPANTRSSVLDGFTVTEGIGSTDTWLNDSSILVGGGVKCLGATPTIQNCTVKRNRALLGAGIYASIGGDNAGPTGSSVAGPLVLDCVIESNQAQGTPSSAFVPQGGGFMSVNCSPEIDSTEVHWNTSTQLGGGVAFWNEDIGGNPGVPTVRPLVRDSSVLENSASFQGGGFYIFQNVNPKIVRTLINSNEAGGQALSIGEGGGLFWSNCQVELEKCHIGGNQADIAGGGIRYEGEGDLGIGDPQGPGSRLTHCTIENNQTTDTGIAQGGGIRGLQGQDQGNIATTRFENCLIVTNSAENGGGGYFTFTKVLFQNCTISQNTARGTSLGDYVGGVVFNQGFGPAFSMTLQDTIITGNRSTTAVPPNAWNVDFQDQSQQAAAFFINCLMRTATLHPLFVAPTTNLARGPVFASGFSSQYFPNGRFHLSFAPQQAQTSPAYNAGSQVVGPQLAVNGMTCRTAGTTADAGLVDMGFHYPKLVTYP